MGTMVAKDFRELAGVLAPTAVSQYLSAQQWELKFRQEGVREIWRFPAWQGGDARDLVMLPLATDYADFAARFEEALLAVAVMSGTPGPVALADKINSVRADLFFVRLDQPTINGMIPFRQAESTIEALYKMLKAAATTAHDPGHSHQGRRAARVNEFLEREIQLGQTQRGSFVFTVAASLGSIPASESGRGTLFAREAMRVLAHGLETTHELTRSRDVNQIDSAADHGLSAGFVESLEQLAEPAALRSLDLSFHWASGEPRPIVGLRPIVLDRNALSELACLRERLVRREEPPRRETLIGLVRSLSREDGSAEEPDSATITLIADVRGKSRSILVPLTGVDHEWAIHAYTRRIPLTVTGDLVRERRTWRLKGDIILDSSFLRHHIAGQP